MPKRAYTMTRSGISYILPLHLPIIYSSCYYSYCDTRYKILGQWTGIPLLFASSKTLKTEIVKDSPSEISFKLQQEYTIKVFHGTKVVNSLVTLTLDEQGKIKYHKDQWNSKDYSHEGLGFIFKKLNGDYLPIITQPPKDL